MEQVFDQVEDQSDSDGTEENGTSTGREKSAQRFPYSGLDDAERIALAVHNLYGGACKPEQLAAHLKTTVSSGGFRSRVSGAGQFGLISTSKGQIRVTDLGRRIVTEGTQRRARVEAFYHVPLYKQLYDEYSGSRLPKDAGLEAAIERLGVTTKQTDRARQAFQRSAKHAGFSDAGTDRLVEPALGRESEEKTAPSLPNPPEENETQTGNLEKPATGVAWQDSLIEGLFNQLPENKQTPFSADQQAQWIDLAKLILATVWKTNATSQKAGSTGQTSESQSS